MSQTRTSQHPWPQSIAGAALSYLSSRADTGAQPKEATKVQLDQLTPLGNEADAPKDATRPPAVPSVEVTAPIHSKASISTECGVTGAITYQPPQAAIPRPLPSLLRYVDGVLMSTAAMHNHPPQPDANCFVCLTQWDTPINAAKVGSNPPAVTSTFLALSPCGHWIHYRCLIWLATQHHDRKGKCYECGTQLFEWEGITALTLATRTGLNMENGYLGGFSSDSDSVEYELECALILSLVHAQFFSHLAKPSKYADGSPDLVQCFYDVLEALERMKKPQARWLQYSTQTGWLLFGMLVTIKMRRYLVEGHARIQATDGWKEFEEGRKTLQEKILGEVNKSGEYDGVVPSTTLNNE